MNKKLGDFEKLRARFVTTQIQGFFQSGNEQKTGRF